MLSQHWLSDLERWMNRYRESDCNMTLLLVSTMSIV